MIIRNSGGYTLVEMVVTAALVGVLSVGIVSVFLSTINGAKSARAQATVKTQGDYAIVSMERTIRNAIAFPVCGADGNEITFKYLDADKQIVTQRYLFISGAEAGTGATNGQIEMFVNGVSQGYVIKSGQLVNSIEVARASFGCIEGDGYNPGMVTVSLTLDVVGENRLETTQVFQTKITMRNIP